jgi:hypothetical protein
MLHAYGRLAERKVVLRVALVLVALAVAALSGHTPIGWDSPGP